MPPKRTKITDTKTLQTDFVITKFFSWVKLLVGKIVELLVISFRCYVELVPPMVSAKGITSIAAKTPKVKPRFTEASECLSDSDLHGTNSK
jgi:hypothetical protein